MPNLSNQNHFLKQYKYSSWKISVNRCTAIRLLNFLISQFLIGGLVQWRSRRWLPLGWTTKGPTDIGPRRGPQLKDVLARDPGPSTSLRAPHTLATPLPLNSYPGVKQTDRLGLEHCIKWQAKNTDMEHLCEKGYLLGLGRGGRLEGGRG